MGVPYPSGQLLKATLIAGTVPMAGLLLKDHGGDDEEPNLEPLGPRPNGIEGFGRVQLNTSLPINGDRDIFFINDRQIINGERIAFHVPLERSDHPLVVVLAYADPPAAVASESALINDIDVSVQFADGMVVFKPTLLSGLMGEERHSNVEKIVLEPVKDPIVATVVVSGYRVSEADHQTFSLFMTGQFGDVTEVELAPSPSAAPTMAPTRVDECQLDATTIGVSVPSIITPLLGGRPIQQVLSAFRTDLADLPADQTFELQLGFEFPFQDSCRDEYHLSWNGFASFSGLFNQEDCPPSCAKTLDHTINFFNTALDARLEGGVIYRGNLEVDGHEALAIVFDKIRPATGIFEDYVTVEVLIHETGLVEVAVVENNLHFYSAPLFMGLTNPDAPPYTWFDGPASLVEEGYYTSTCPTSQVCNVDRRRRLEEARARAQPRKTRALQEDMGILLDAIVTTSDSCANSLEVLNRPLGETGALNFQVANDIPTDTFVHEYFVDGAAEPALTIVYSFADSKPLRERLVEAASDGVTVDWTVYEGALGAVEPSATIVGGTWRFSSTAGQQLSSVFLQTQTLLDAPDFIGVSPLTDRGGCLGASASAPVDAAADAVPADLWGTCVLSTSNDAASCATLYLDGTPTAVGSLYSVLRVEVEPTPPPTDAPTASPTASPLVPTLAPTHAPTAAPTPSPTVAPTASPTASPTMAPTGSPTKPPTSAPSAAPSAAPSSSPTVPPTASPTPSPTDAPTASPTPSPSAAPSVTPTPAPSSAPTASPTSTPTASPTGSGSAAPTGAPTPSPSETPTHGPTATPTARPTMVPTSFRHPTATPTASFAPTATATEVLDATTGVRRSNDPDDVSGTPIILMASSAFLCVLGVLVVSARIGSRKEYREEIARDSAVSELANTQSDLTPRTNVVPNIGALDMVPDEEASPNYPPSADSATLEAAGARGGGAPGGAGAGSRPSPRALAVALSRGTAVDRQQHLQRLQHLQQVQQQQQQQQQRRQRRHRQQQEGTQQWRGPLGWLWRSREQPPSPVVYPAQRPASAVYSEAAFSAALEVENDTRALSPSVRSPQGQHPPPAHEPVLPREAAQPEGFPEQPPLPPPPVPQQQPPLRQQVPARSSSARIAAGPSATTAMAYAARDIGGGTPSAPSDGASRPARPAPLVLPEQRGRQPEVVFDGEFSHMETASNASELGTVLEVSDESSVGVAAMARGVPPPLPTNVADLHAVESVDSISSAVSASNLSYPGSAYGAALPPQGTQGVGVNFMTPTSPTYPAHE